MFLILDAVVLTTTCYAYHRMKGVWDSCQHSFKAWSLSIISFMVLSLLLNCMQVYSLKHMKAYVRSAEYMALHTSDNMKGELEE